VSNAERTEFTAVERRAILQMRIEGSTLHEIAESFKTTREKIVQILATYKVK